MNIQDTINSVVNSFPSLFSKDDVLHLLNQIEIPKPVPTLTPELIEDLIDTVVNALSGEDLFDSDNCDFDISLNYDNRIEVEVTTVGTNDNEIEKICRDAIVDWCIENTQPIEDEEAPVPDAPIDYSMERINDIG